MSLVAHGGGPEGPRLRGRGLRAIPGDLESLQGLANPIGQIWSGAMMLEHLGHGEAARAVEAAIAQVVAEDRALTPDLGGTASTAELGQAIAEAVESTET
jgi:isocitrate/isopropylmalate dehydrogenase